MGNRDFLKMKAPPGYKAGIGRGATPFGSTSLKRAAPASEEPEDGQFDDAATGDDHGLLSGKNTRDDVAAEKIWSEVESRRHRRKQESAPKVSMTTIATQFADLKGSLAAVSDDAWLSLPEASDMTRKNKRLREEERETRRSYALPDSMLIGDDSKVNIDRMRPVLEQLIKVEPTNPQGWISLAKLENDAMRFRHAKSIIAKGCLKCPNAPEVWLENIDMHKPSEARSIAAKAVGINPKSRELWDKAVSLEDTDIAKLQVVHKALEQLPSDAGFWALASDLEAEESDKLAVLNVAVELCAYSPVLWTRLVKLSQDKSAVLDKAISASTSEHVDHELLYLGLQYIDDPSKLKQLAEKAADASRDDRSQWLADISTLNNEAAVSALVEALELGPDDLKVFFDLAQTQQQVLLDHIPQNEDVLLRLTEAPSPHLKTLLVEAVSRFPTNIELWKRYIKVDADGAHKKLLEHQSPDLLVLAAEIDEHPENVLEKACDLYPENARLWYKYVHRLRIVKQPKKALEVARKAVKVHPSCAQLHLQLYQLGYPDKTAFDVVDDSNPLKPALWVESASRATESIQKRAILSRALKQLPSSELLWLRRVQLESRENNTALLSQALQECPQSAALWYEEILSKPSTQRKRRLADAIAATGGAGMVLLAAALQCYATNKPDQGDQFMAKALAKDEDNGDIWMWALQYGVGSPTRMPHHGFEWPAIIKNPDNAGELSDWPKLAVTKKNPFAD